MLHLAVGVTWSPKRLVFRSLVEQLRVAIICACARQPLCMLWHGGASDTLARGRVDDVLVARVWVACA